MKNSDSVSSRCREQLHFAERELGAFIAAVTEVYGPEQAKLSAGDWIDELEQISGAPRAAGDLRVVTIAASFRLAGRVEISAASAEFARPESSTDTKVLSIPSSNCFRSGLVA